MQPGHALVLLGLDFTLNTQGNNMRHDLGTEQLLLDIEPPLAWITFNRPEARNAMTWAMYDGLVRACEAVDTAKDVRALLLTGAGEQAFVSGTDIGQFREFGDGKDALAYEARMDTVLRRLEAVRCATIAVVRGYAMGGGAAIALACDLRVCAGDLQLGIPIARTLGNTLNVANFRRLVAAIGPSRAREIMFTARSLSAEEARLTGVANEVVPPERLIERARELALTIAANAPLTIQSAKQAIRAIVLDEPLDEEALVLSCYQSQDFREGVNAFFEKRKPRWTGR